MNMLKVVFAGFLVFGSTLALAVEDKHERPVEMTEEESDGAERSMEMQKKFREDQERIHGVKRSAVQAGEEAIHVKKD